MTLHCPEASLPGHCFRQIQVLMAPDRVEGYAESPPDTQPIRNQ